jgi:hypothetical protein
VRRATGRCHIYSQQHSVPPMERDFGTLVISDEGRSRYVNHNFWARVTEEVYLRHLVPREETY